jgi:hypothetical protein
MLRSSPQPLFERLFTTAYDILVNCNLRYERFIFHGDPRSRLPHGEEDCPSPASIVV